MRASFSWSKPDNVPRLIARKQVDKSMFLEGSHIPKEFHPDFAHANGGELPGLGESRVVTLHYEDKVFPARLVNQPRHGHGSSDLSILYGRNSGFALLLRDRLNFSYRRFVVEEQQYRSIDDIPEDEREYVEFYETGEPYHYEVRLVERSGPTDAVVPTDFAVVWSHLADRIGTETVIRTLSRGAENTVSWRVEGIQVTTDRGTELLPKAWFEATWQALREREILPVDEFPGQARYRSTAISAILAQLPYVDYTTYPKTTLFLTSHRFTNAELADTFKVGTQRGIRVAGRSPDTKLVVFITGSASDYKIEHPYQDHWKGDTLFYTGEGQIGDQQMTQGNLALKNSMTDRFPVYGFRKLPDGGYAYLGRFQVNAIHEEQQPDNTGTPRRVYVFEMTRVRPQVVTGTKRRAWIFQANPRYYNLSAALGKLSNITFLVNQFKSEIRAGDKVYFWEAGPNGGLVGTGTVLTDPKEMHDDEESRPFYVDPHRFEGEQLRTVVRVDQVLSRPIARSVFLDHPILRDMTVLTARVGTNFRLTPEQADALAELVAAPTLCRFYRVTAPRTPEDWTTCRERGLLLLDVDVPVTNLALLASESDVRQAIASETGRTYGLPSSHVERQARELFTIKDLRPGDKLVVTRGPNTIVGLAEVVQPGYTWLANEARHAIHVTWQWTGFLRTTRRPEWLTAVITPSDKETYDEVVNSTAPKTEPRADLAAITRDFSMALRLSGIQFGTRHDEVVRAFVAALATKRLVILTGLSGSGKTQIALRFGDWLGKDRRMVVPVRPDWTGPDYLFGYEDALKPLVNGRRPWYVPPVLAFMLKAARDPHYPYLLVLDEMNLGHVERYFADFLSGIESGEPCLPNLEQDPDGNWVIPEGAAERIPMPENLFVVGTVNVDETTYMFSPKVLDRANTFEFRVETEDLQVTLRKPLPLTPGADDLVRGFLAVATDDEWQHVHPAPWRDEFAAHLRTVHRLLAEGDFEFGHRVFYEALRYASMLASAGNATLEAALDQQIYQKVLPRLHGSRRRLEPLLRALGHFCYDFSSPVATGTPDDFDPEAAHEGQPKLPLSYQKIRRMFRSLRVNQFTSFTE